MTVVDYRGVVGRIAHVFPSSSNVYLINNKSISVSCVNRRSRVVGILEWDQGSIFRLEYLGREEDVMRGDTLLTSGLGRLFPKGFPVGVVYQIVDDRSALAKRVNVVSAANLSALEELFIITGGRAWEGGEITDELEKVPAKQRGGRR
jgi:rod shape-determining protein MreC